MAQGTVTTACREYRGRRNDKGYGVDGHGRLIHRIVDGPIPAGVVVMHRCDNPPCFRYDHLERGSQLENIADRDAKGRGRWNTGSAHHNSKLNEDDARAILQSDASWKFLADVFEVSKHTIYCIKHRKTWRNV